MSNLVTYAIDKMRVTRPTAKAAERNPERVYTVSGVFHSTKLDDKGKLTRKDKLSFVSKNIDRDMLLAEGVVIDLQNGVLTIPEGKRGRTAAESLSQDDIAAELEALRNPVPATDPAS